MINLKLQCCWHSNCLNNEEFHAWVQCLFALYAVHAYKHLSLSCAIQENLVPVACVNVCGGRHNTHQHVPLDFRCQSLKGICFIQHKAPLEVFTATKLSVVFSGKQPYQDFFKSPDMVVCPTKLRWIKLHIM